MSQFNTGWKFQIGDVKDAWQKGFDDSSWRVVTLPHDWSVENPFDIRYSSGTGYLPGGTAFYRKVFYLTENSEKNITVTFDGVYKNAQVWINGNYLGYRPYGYSTFSFDISDFCIFGEVENVIAVKVSHDDVADSRWFTGSGIYRKVSLLVKNIEHFKEYGVFVYTKKADKNSALLLAELCADVKLSCDVICTVFNADGVQIASAQGVTEGDSTLEITIDNPNLWSTDNPYLYRVVAELQRDGNVIDSFELKTGIRTFNFDANNGFTLNGELLKLKGICVHHDAGCLGAAVPEKVWRDRLLTLKYIGANALRTAHNPPMPELLDLCDELGFLVIDEAFDEWEGCKNKWSTGHNVYPPKHYGYYEHFPEWHDFDLSAMVLRDRNHPSIIMWSVGNEIDYPNDPYCHQSFETFVGNNDANKPKAELMFNPNKPNAMRLPQMAKQLVNIVKRHDTTRPVSAAVAFPELSDKTGYSESFDVIGYNYKEHLYDEIHKEHPEWIIFGSENNHGYDKWTYVRDNAYISGQFLWTGIDFLGETRVWPCHGSGAGLLDLAGIMKPVAYYRKSLWSKTPVAKLFARITGEWRESWNFTENAEVKVVCYTNCKQAELFIDEKSLGKVKPEQNIAEWIVPYQNGVLKVVTDEGVTDTLTNINVPIAVQLESAHRNINADGQDIAIIRATVVDKDGRIADDAAHRIFAEVKGGILLGLENGDLNDTQEYALPSRHAYNGRLTLYVRADTQPGTMKVYIRSAKLEDACIEIEKR